MYYLISIILREPDILYEADPLPDLLALWKRHHVPTAMILEKVDMQDLGSYYVSAMGIVSPHQPSPDDDGFLFSVPEQQRDTAKTELLDEGGHRMLLTIMEGTEESIGHLLDLSTDTIQEKLDDAGEMIFVFPLAHVRGFPGAG